ncbi:beta-ketoacyl synthase domain-containing protein [Poronia punctata]|nr:beta-ketoacyl synthase domain-containing protein [Poronia punctata]
MSFTSQLPSLLVFGPHTRTPTGERLEELRRHLNDTTRLSALRDAVADLPRFWNALVDFDSDLSGVPASHIHQLSQWLKDGGSIGHDGISTPNHYSLAATLLLQISQYSRYLDSLGEGAHPRILKSVRAGGGIQGFCSGFLSTVAVAGAETEADLGRTAAVALRLAVCIGAYVDLDGIYSQRPERYSCVAIRWKDGSARGKSEVVDLIQSFPNAYISSINDDACVTVTLRADDVDTLNDEVRAAGFRSTAVSVQGRFHTLDHANAAAKITNLVAQAQDLSIPSVERLFAPVRSAVDGKILTGGGSLLEHILENTLLKTVDWNLTLQSSADQIPDGVPKVAAVAGFGNHMPQSVVQSSSLEIVMLGQLDMSKPGSSRPEYPPHSIAVIGMAGRFPGADSVEELWDLLVEGKSTLEPAPADRLGLSQVGEFADTKWWGNFVRDSDAFDHRFFKKSSREALAWDPQQRVLLEVIYTALESAGYFGPSSSTEPKDYGCYIGACISNYIDNLSCHAPTAYATMGTTRGFISGAMSHYFGWTGPALTIDTACSSSLVAINTACRAIWSGECSRAVAGGTNIISSPFDYHNLSAAGFLSPNGQCKPFDAGADGYCRGEGTAVVILKRLSDALNDGDDILGVITGSAANQNHNEGLITVPHSGSQSELYNNVLKLSGLPSESVTYVEAHGTGTGVGDPVEVRSIREVFGGPQRDSPLHFASIKGNIGHTEGTAGIAGLIKVLLMMKHKLIPKQVSHNRLNPKIPSLEQDRMVIPRDVTSWDAKFLAACVNSYGAAGSNSALMVLEKPSRSGGDPESLSNISRWPVVISANSASSLATYCKKLLKWIKNSKTGASQNLLASLAFQLAKRANHALPHVLSTTVTSLSDLESKLEIAASGSSSDSVTVESPKPVVLVFGGQESDFVGLSRDVYNSSKAFRQHLNACNHLLIAQGLEGFFPNIFNREPMQDLVTLHTALFATQYASAKAWMDGGLRVDAVVGHSFGHLTALCVSGVLSLSDAIKLVSGRASLMMKHWGNEPGSMLFVQADRQTVTQALETLSAQDESHYAEIACCNGPKSHVVVGSSLSISAVEQYFASRQGSVRTKKLQVTHGFHSKFTEPMLVPLGALAQSLSWQSPAVHLESCNEDDSVSDPDFDTIAEHTRRPVFFQQAIERLAKRFPQGSTWIEVGRGSSVISLAKGSVQDSHGHRFFSPQLAAQDAQDSLVNVTLDLWKAGYAVQYWPFHKSQKLDYGPPLDIPGYQFEKVKHWLPFTGNRLDRGETATPNQAPAEEGPPEILSFIGFNGKAGNEAIFRINPSAERFKTMLAGHVMAGEGLCPASLYYELVSRAAYSVQKDTTAATHVPTVYDLAMKSPIGSDANVNIVLKLKAVNGGPHPSWNFSFTTQATGTKYPADPFEVSTGTVCLKRRDDLQTAKEFGRFESLTGIRRIEDVLKHPDAEMMQGTHIYRAFTTVVYYGPVFRGIKQIASVGMEAAGKVTITPDMDGPDDQRLTDTPMTDSFMQFAGFLVNYFNNPSTEDVLVCGKIEHIEIGGSFNPDAKEWVVYATMTQTGDNSMSADAYVFEASSKKMVMAIFGLKFNKMSQAMLGRMLRSVNKTKAQTSSPSQPTNVHATAAVVEKPASTAVQAPSANKASSRSKRPELFQLLSEITDVPVEDINDEKTLEDLGIDSLMATEVLNGVRSTLGLTIDLTSFTFFEDVGAFADHVDEKLGIEIGSDAASDSIATPAGSWDMISTDSSSPSPSSTDEDVFAKSYLPALTSQPKATAVERIEPPPANVQRPKLNSAAADFKSIRLRYDQLAEGTKAKGFWSEAYPHQSRLVLAYVVEAFAELGCNLNEISPGDEIPQVQGVLPRHNRLIAQLFTVLEKGKLIFRSTDESYARTDNPTDPDSAESIYHQIIDLHPQHADVNRLVRVVGSKLADCLVGKTDGIQTVFGNKEAKKTLQDIYEFWPLFRTPTLVLGDFLTRALTNATGGGKFRILECGAGTGGTTRYVIKLLKSHGIEFEYVFTDISASLVAAGKQQFKGVDGMTFEVLDVEQKPKPELEGAFHCIIASNTVHATRDLAVTLRNLRAMLREDGALTLVEITRQVYWLDIVFGQFEGWWLFDDGRTHALMDEENWEKRMRAAGFNEVLWSDGMTPESKTVRTIAAFPAKSQPEKKPASPVKVALETVVYKRIGDLDIHADVYYPTNGESPEGGRPVALMIHGGSHIMFTRKDVRPPQTRLLVERGFLPVALDHRLCPEVSLSEGPMVDVCDALEWARNTLPYLKLKKTGVKIDGERVVVVGWSSGGQLAMSTAWTAPQRGLRPPEAILAFYCPTNYEDSWWRNPIQPIGAEDTGLKYDVLEAVQDKPVTNYGLVGAWEPLSDPRILTDARCRIVLHINWKSQTLPIITGGLPSRKKANEMGGGKDWNNLPQPSLEAIRTVSPMAQIRAGNYNTPTFLIHGTADDLIPWQQSQGTYEAMVEQGIPVELALVENAPHITDLSSDPNSKGWQAALQGYDFICRYV